MHADDVGCMNNPDTVCWYTGICQQGLKLCFVTYQEQDSLAISFRQKQADTLHRF